MSALPGALSVVSALPFVGRSALVSLLNGERPPTASTPVFGCPLFGPADAAESDGAHIHDN